MQPTMQYFSKPAWTRILASILLIVSGTSLRGQAQNEAPHPARSRADEILEMWNAIGNKLLAMAQDFPEDKYDFKVQKDERTFALNLLHAAALDFVLIRRISGSNLGPDFGEGDNPTRDQFKTKADVVRFVQEAVADGAKVIQQQGDAGLDKTTKFFGNRLAHNSHIWMFAIEHSAEHYGQLVVYYRANNLIPPDSRRNAQASQPASAARVVDLKSPDSTPLKATYFAAAKPGPGVLLLHQSNRDRKSWDGEAAQLAALGFNTLTLDMRGFGESGGTRDDFKRMPEDVDTALEFLMAQPGVDSRLIGLGGAGWLGVTYSVEAARRHPKEIKSLVLMSGETGREGLQFLRETPQLPELFVFSDDDEYPPTQDAMKLLYLTASSASKKLVHYSAAEDAPWLWYETSDASRVPAHGTHGTDLFQMHSELPGIVEQWFLTTLVKTPGHAPADSLAAASVLNQRQIPGGALPVKQQLVDARKKDPQVQLWPEAAVDIIGEDYQRAGDIKNAIAIFQLNLLAYPDSADANDNLADAYLADGQKDLARQYAERALALLNSHKTPLSSWSDTEPRREEVRHSAQQTLAQATK
jgi:pimeloyl-ACP methyl ester carboxylesterase/uncharacterized damage-inducible protein DinB